MIATQQHMLPFHIAPLLPLACQQFVQRAKMIKNRVVRNEATHGGSLALRQENEGLRKLIADQVRMCICMCARVWHHMLRCYDSTGVAVL